MKKKKIIIISAIAVVLIAAIVVTALLLLKNGKKYTVRFIADDAKVIKEVKLKKNESLVLPKGPSKEGFVFLNWLDEDGNPIVVSSIKITRDRVLTAKWVEEGEELVTIKFDTDGGSQINDITVVKGEKVALPENPTKEGYDFKKWVDPEGKDFNADNAIEEDITLKAIWEKQEEKKEEQKKEESKKEEPKPAENVEVTGVSLDKSQVDLIIGNSGKLTATVSPSNASDKSVSWSSSNTSVISVDQSGNLSAKDIGDATITVKTANGKTASATVYSDVESISLSVTNQYISKHGGAPSSATLKVTTVPQVKDAKITWNTPSYPTGYLTVLGSTAYFNANNTSVYQANTISAYVGRKTSNQVKVYVEPELALTPSTEISLLSGGTGSAKSNIPVSWSLGTTSDITLSNVNKQTTSLSFTADNNVRRPAGFQITATSNAGQKAYLRVTVSAARQ